MGVSKSLSSGDFVAKSTGRLSSGELGLGQPDSRWTHDLAQQSLRSETTDDNNGLGTKGTIFKSHIDQASLILLESITGENYC